MQKMTDTLGDKAVDMAAKGRFKTSIDEDHPAKDKPQYYLASPKLPTIPHCLVQRIWDLEFVEKHWRVLKESSGC